MKSRDDEYFEFINGTGENEDLKQECENLLQSSNYDHDEISELEKELWYYSEEQLNSLKANLYMNQTDLINAGHNYSQTDIKRKLREI